MGHYTVWERERETLSIQPLGAQSLSLANEKQSFYYALLFYKHWIRCRFTSLSKHVNNMYFVWNTLGIHGVTLRWHALITSKMAYSLYFEWTTTFEQQVWTYKDANNIVVLMRSLNKNCFLLSSHNDWSRWWCLDSLSPYTIVPFQVRQ